MLRFSQLFSSLFFLWAEIGSVLDPDGRLGPNAGDSGDTGSGLEPNG
jgi:hypothetical protein